MSTKAKIAIITYSMYGHINTMAECIKQGIIESNKAEVTIYKVNETLPADVLTKMHAPKQADYPIATPDTLKNADGIMFGFPTRFGNVPAQIKAFLDSTGGLWSDQSLSGKPAGIFFSTASQGGGQESTAFSLIPYFAHHGLVYVPLGYATPNLFKIDQVVGGSPWGCGTVAGPTGERQPSDTEKEIARVHGKQFATFAAKLVNSPK